MSGCEGCVQSIKEKNEAINKIRKEAKEAAIRDGVGYAIYFDEYSRPQYIRGDFANQYNVAEYVSPILLDVNL